jgi:hypothetical protein
MTRSTLIRSVRVLLAAAALCVATTPASAQRASSDAPVGGAFEAKFELVSSNCKDTGMKLGRVSVDLAERARGRLDVTVPMVPVMSGVVSRGGKFKAEAKRGKTAIAGLEGRFSVAGRVEGKTIQFLLIAEYYQGGKALCTQSWNAGGPKR